MNSIESKEVCWPSHYDKQNVVGYPRGQNDFDLEQLAVEALHTWIELNSGRASGLDTSTKKPRSTSARRGNDNAASLAGLLFPADGDDIPSPANSWQTCWVVKHDVRTPEFKRISTPVRDKDTALIYTLHSLHSYSSDLLHPAFLLSRYFCAEYVPMYPATSAPCPLSTPHPAGRASAGPPPLPYRI